MNLFTTIGDSDTVRKGWTRCLFHVTMMETYGEVSRLKDIAVNRLVKEKG